MNGRNLAVQIKRIGSKGEVWVHSSSGKNEFGNNVDDYTFDREVIAAKSYPNRNTEVATHVGDRHRDRPIFFVPKGPDQPEPPGEKDRFVYDKDKYEVKAHTEYDSHVEFFGQIVRN